MAGPCDALAMRSSTKQFELPASMILALELMRLHEVPQVAFRHMASAHTAAWGNQPVLTDAPSWPSPSEVELTDHQVGTPLPNLP